MTHGAWHELLHAAAAVVLVGGGAVFLGLAALGRRDPPGGPRAFTPPVPIMAPIAPVLTLLAATLAVAAGLIHLAAAPVHVAELGPLGWAFVGAALFQGSWALAWAIQPGRGVALVGAAGTIAILAGWAWTRAVGLPVGPLAGIPEPIGVPDAAATLFEVALLGLLLVRCTGSEPRLAAALRHAPAAAPIAVVPAVGIVFLATTLAISQALGHSHAAGEGHAGDGSADPAGITAEPRH